MNKNKKMNENDVQNEKDWLKAVNVQTIKKISVIQDDYDDEEIEFETRHCNYTIMSSNEMASEMKIFERQIYDINSMKFEKFKEFSISAYGEIYNYEDDIRYLAEDCCRELSGYRYADEASSLFYCF